MSTLKGSQNYIWSTLDVLGQGATGAVFKARHKRTGEVYAVKTFNQMSHMRPLTVQMREFEVLQKLKHENIVRLLAIEEESGTRSKVLVMELCTGGSLYGMLDDTENAYGLEEKEFVKVVKDVVAGMQHLREQDIVHRDIKPGNIMRYISEDGRSIYKLTDFGAARELQEEEQFMSLYGTEEYLYPDMYERAVLRRPTGKQFDSLVDLWSLGVTFYHVATGKLPFRPYGGRRNRETMYRITAEKQSGVITGVQHTENGQVEWSRELPNTCRLSQGAKNLVTPIIAGLMECDADKMWGYDRLFKTVKSMDEKHIIYVFSMCNCEALHIYIDKNETLARLQELIAEQTEIPAQNQYLLFENNPLENMVDTMQASHTYPHTSQDNPIFLFHGENTTPRPLVHSLPQFPVINNIVVLESDATLAKSCCGTLHFIKRKIADSIKKQQLISRAAKMFLFALCKDIEQVRSFVTQFALLVEESGKRVQYFLDSHDLNMRMLCLLDRTFDGGNQDQSLETDKQELHQLSMNSKPAFEEICKGMEEMKRYTEDYYKRIVINKELSVRWKDNIGCMDEDRCNEKIDIITKEGHEILTSFRKNRSLKRLSYNEEQIHKFEKSKLNSFCLKATQLVQGHCQPSQDLVFRKFVDWYQLGSKVRVRLGRIEKQVTSLQDRHAELAENVDQHQVQHKTKLEEMIVRVNNSSFTTTNPNPQYSIIMENALNSDTRAPGSSGPDIPLRRGSQSKSALKRSSLMKELNNSLMALKDESSQVKSVLNENAQLLSQLEMLSDSSNTSLGNND